MIDRKKVREVLADCEKALSIVAERHGLILSRKACTFTSESMPVAFKLDAPRTREGAEVNAEQAAYLDHRAMWGLGKVGLGAEVLVREERYTVIGAKPKSRKYPIVVKRCSDGRRFKMDPRSILFGWSILNPNEREG